MDGHLRVDDLVDATRQLVTVESPTDDLTACAEVVKACLLYTSPSPRDS